MMSRRRLEIFETFKEVKPEKEALEMLFKALETRRQRGFENLDLPSDILEIIMKNQLSSNVESRKVL